MDNLRNWVDVLFKVALGVAGAVVAYYFSFQKQQNDDIKFVVEMTSAPEPHRRIMGGEVAKAYWEQRRIPESVYLAVYQYANKSGDPELRASVNASVTEAVRADPQLGKVVEKVSVELPVRVYFHIRRDEDRERAKAIAGRVGDSVLPSGQRVLVPGVQFIAGTQAKSELRCFKKTECETIGPLLGDLMKGAGADIELKDLSVRYENSIGIRPNHFEVWFAALS